MIFFEIKTNNYKAWAKGLKKAGYATDPKYPEKLISLTERFELNKFDLKKSKKLKKYPLMVFKQVDKFTM